MDCWCRFCCNFATVGIQKADNLTVISCFNFVLICFLSVVIGNLKSGKDKGFGYFSC